jgi:hypothetical protein
MLKDKTYELIQGALQYIPFKNDSSYLIGNSMYSAQLSTTNSLSEDETTRIALENGLAIADSDACVRTLKRAYNISDAMDLIIVKTDMNSYLDLENLYDPYISNKVDIKIYSPITRKELNMTLCQKDQFSIKTPIKTVDLLNMTLYQDMEKSGIDVYNPNSNAFNSFCFSYVDNETQYDTTINSRRSNYFQNKTATCVSSANCVYEKIDIHNYVNCNCTNWQPDSQVSNKFVNYIFAPISRWNFEVIKCYYMIPRTIAYNIGCYVGFSLFLLAFIFSSLLFCIDNTNLKENKDLYYYYDCKNYDKTLDKELYFTKCIVKDLNRTNEMGTNPNYAMVVPIEVGQPKLFQGDADAVESAIHSPVRQGTLVLRSNTYQRTSSKDLNSVHEETMKNDYVINIHPVIHNNYLVGEDQAGNNNSDESLSVNEDMAQKPVVITFHDYKSLKLYEFKYDTRPFLKYLKCHLIEHHRILSIIFKKSLFDPVHLRVNKLIFELSMTFALSAILFSDTYIDGRANSDDNVRMIITAFRMTSSTQSIRNSQKPSFV